MLSRLRSHISGNVVGYLALFVALGGTSYAFATGSIDSREIKNNTVRTGDLRNNEVRSRDIRNRTLVGRDHLSNSLGGEQIDEDRLGKVPSAAAADNALALGGVSAGNFPTTFANAADFEDGATGTVLSLPGFGVLQLASPAGCDTGGNDATVEFVNGSGGSLDFVFSSPDDSPATTFERLQPDGTSSEYVLGADADVAQIRLGSADNAGRQATIELFYAPLAQGTQCRLSAQALVSG